MGKKSGEQRELLVNATNINKDAKRSLCKGGHALATCNESRNQVHPELLFAVYHIMWLKEWLKGSERENMVFNAFFRTKCINS